MNSKTIFKFIEERLNILGAQKDITFAGGIDFIDSNWISRKYDIPQSPFSLVPNRFNIGSGGTNVDFSYALYILPFEDDREYIIDIVNELNQDITSLENIADINVNMRTTNVQYGADFPEGSGLGRRRFEAIVWFEGNMTSNYKLNNNITLNIQDENVPIISFKYDAGKINFVNKLIEYDSENNKNINSNMLVIETPLNSDNFVVTNLLNKGQTVNLDLDISLNAGSTVIFDNKFNFNGFSISTSTSSQFVSAFLYFTLSGDRDTITINGESIPILDYAIATSYELIPHSAPNTNSIKNHYTNRATSFAFNISEDDAFPILKTLTEDLVSNREDSPHYDVVFNIRGVEVLKNLVISDISKESRDTTNNVIKVVFLERG